MSNQVNQDNQANLMDKVKLCSFDGCNRRALAKGLCRAHYRQQAQGKDLKPIRVYRKKTKEIKEIKENNLQRYGLCLTEDKEGFSFLIYEYNVRSIGNLGLILKITMDINREVTNLEWFNREPAIAISEMYELSQEGYNYLRNLVIGDQCVLWTFSESYESSEPLKDHEPSHPVPLHSVTSVEPDTAIQVAHGRIRQSLKGLRKGVSVDKKESRSMIAHWDIRLFILCAVLTVNFGIHKYERNTEKEAKKEAQSYLSNFDCFDLLRIPKNVCDQFDNFSSQRNKCVLRQAEIAKHCVNHE